MPTIRMLRPATLAAVLLAMITPLAHAASHPDSIPTGVQMLMERGGIPAVFAPQFVSAAEADLPDSAWVLGIEIAGEARAYSLNLLNGHEIVNDSVGGRPIAAVW